MSRRLPVESSGTPAKKMRTVRVGNKEIAYDETHALDAYRRVRAGSLIGAAFTQLAFAELRRQLGPRWKDVIFARIAGAPEATEETEETTEEAGDEEGLNA